MKNIKKKNIIYLSAMTLILVFLTVMISLIFPSLHVTPVFPYILVFYFLVTLLILFVLGKSMQKRIRYFVNTYMLVTFVKLILFSLVIIAYILINRKDAIPFVFTFFIYYLFYTIFEVVVLREMSESTKENP